MAALSIDEAAGRLRRVLAVERQGGCQDRAVMGGLDRLLGNLLAQQPQGETPVLAVVQTLGRHRYAELGAEERRAWIERALRLLAAAPSPVVRSPAQASQAGGSAPSGARAGSAGVPQRGRTEATRLSPPAPRADAHPASTTTSRPASTAAAGAEARAARSVPAANGTAGAGTKPLAAPARGAGRRMKAAGDEPGAATRLRSKAGGPTLDSPVTAIPGIGANRAELLAKLDLLTVRDLLYHFPHRHEDFSRVAQVADLQVGETQTVVARVWSASLVSFGQSPRKSTELIVGDETGNLRVVFFNNPYPAASLRTNQRLTLSDKVTAFHGQKQLENPEWEIVEQGGDLDQAIHTGRLVPVYPLTQGIQNRALRGYVRKALDLCADQLEDPLPAELRLRHGHVELAQAIRQAHYPDNAEALETARRRLAYDELLMLQLAVVARKARRAASVRTAPLPFPPALREQFVAGLPFPLTGAQTRAVERILADLERETPMARLLQGDVGSGKTVVAAAALLAAVVNERQAVLMAPTEILAEQHFRTLCRLLGAEATDGEALAETRPAWLGRPLRLGLLRGGLRARAKRDVQEAIAAGEVEIAIGTQALIQQGVEFARLGLTVIDEQHRFGVLQRSALAEKGENTHLLVMTATPIPRTLALSLYGDLDVSVIDELPPGRKPVKSKVLEPHQREFAYRFIRDQVGQGCQAFVICPLVEESETLEVRAATEEYERLRSEVFPNLRVSLLHGRMSPAEKDAVMAAFRDREADILVSTAVVEVGIDIPAATVIMIEGAERFGLAQLHQFRGRVGRGGDQAYCLLLTDSPAQEARTRLKLLEQTRDGFTLAEEDLKLRGPGDYFGTRQSGLPALRQARLTDTPILEAAREDALALIARDPLLQSPELTALGARVAALAARAGDAN